MRQLIASCVLLLGLGACAVPSRIVDPRDHGELSFSRLIDELAGADVVVLGEIHDNADVHRTHLEIVQALAQRRPLVLSMEMFERDVQTAIYQYLCGAMSETEFLASSRPWDHYQSRYRPLVEFARQHGIMVIAANVPRPLAAEVAQNGLTAAAGKADAAAEVSAPKDQYWERFQQQMGDHAGAAGKMEHYYEAQCLKDATMAESIVEALRGQREREPKAMLVHVCGKFHSDYRLGTVARVHAREKDWKIAVLSAKSSPSGGDAIAMAPDVADYVLVVRGEAEDEDVRLPVIASRTQRHGDDAPATKPEPAAPSGGRPALGFKPDYGAADMTRVEALTQPDGPAAKAGLQPGDVIVGLGKAEVGDLQSYVAALNELEIGSTVDVLVLRDGKVQQLRIDVGSRSR